MDPFIVVAAVLLVVFGTGAALAWWYLVKRAAPYRDERSSGARAEQADTSEVIVLPPAGARGPGGRSES